MEIKIEKQKQLYITIGVSGSGKSSNRKDNCIIISKDNLRYGFLNYEQTNRAFFSEIEDIIKKINLFSFHSFLEEGYNIYLDATNLTTKVRDPYIKEAIKYGYDIHFIIFNNFKEAKKLNLKRERIVPTSLIETQIDTIEELTEEEFNVSTSIKYIKNNIKE